MAKKTPAKKQPAAKTAKKAANKKPVAKPSAAAKKTDKKSPPKKPASKKQSAKKPVAKSQPARRPAKNKEPGMKNTAAQVKKSTKLTAVRGAASEQSVEGYLATLNDWRKDAVASLRKMIQKAAPKAAENVKWSQPVYEHHGPFAWIKAHARHVNLGFWRGVELPDPRKLLVGTGSKMRHIKLSSLKDAGKKELQELVRVAAELNEIKGNPTRPAKGKAKHK